MLDRRDMELLCLAGRYRWLPYGCFDTFGLTGLNEAAELLAKTGLITVSRSKQYFRMSPRGYELLEAQGYTYDPGAKRAFSGSSALRRRLEVAGIMLTCLRAGIDVSRDDVYGLKNQPVFFPAFEMRTGGTNMMNAANCAGFGHWGDKAYILQYVSEENAGMVLTNELSHLHGMASIFDRSLNTPSAMIFAGENYRQIYAQLQNTKPSKRHNKKAFFDFWDVYRKADIPIHLLSCDEMGAVQLALMRQPDYNAKIARAAIGELWTPADELFPEADGCVDGNPLVIAADMDIRRVERVWKAARLRGCAEIMVAAFPQQIEEVLCKVIPMDGTVTLLSMEKSVPEAAFGKDFTLHTVSRSPAAGRKGGAVYV